MVAWKSGIETGRSTMVFANSSVAPMTRPVRKPPPASTRAEGSGLMAAAAAAVELRRTSELGGDHHQRGVQQFRLLQIVQQRREGLIQILNQQVLLHLRGVVRIPTGAVEEVQIERDLDEADAGLHQSAGQQAALAELAAVGLAQSRGLALQIEDVQKSRTGQLEALLADGGLGLHVRIAGMPFGEALAHAGQQRFAARPRARCPHPAGATRPFGPVSVCSR